MKAGNLILLVVGVIFAGFAWAIHDMNRPAAKSSGGVTKLNAVLSGGKPVLVEFYADWCGPCRIVGPEVEKLADEVRSEATVVRFNVDDHRDLASKYGINAIPCFVAFKHGRETKRKIGVITPQEMREMMGLSAG